MLDKKYALISENSVIFVFDVNENTTSSLERAQEIIDGLNKNFVIKDITNTSKVKVGSVWNGTSFSEFNETVKPVKLRRAALVADNTIFGIMFLSTKEELEAVKKAEERGIISVDITDREDSLLIKAGSIWDGTNFINN